MPITERTRGDITLLEVTGELDQRHASELTRLTDELLARGCTQVVADVSKLKFIDSSGVGVLVSLYKRVQAARGEVKLAGLGGQPRELFKLLRLDRAFDVHGSAEAAVKAFAAHRPS